MRKTFLLAVAFVAVLTLAAGIASAQAISGDVIGTVVDATGAAVPSATVTVENVATGVKANATTSQAGEYRVSNLLPGAYNVTVTAKGFTAASVKNLTVEVNRAVTANVTLQVGSTAETVEVNAAAVQIDTSTAHVQNTFETKAAADLPTASIGAGVLNLSLLGSGVSSSGGVGAGTGPAVGGQRPRNNNFTVEGIDNNSKSVTGPLVFIPNDAVAEFTLLQNQFSPEYGHSSGGQFNTVVKSGTNQFHGSIYDYLQNRNLDAIDQSLQNQGFTKNPRYDQNRLGATIGGPIKRNKLFFFGNYEYNPTGLSSSQSAAVETPTAAGYSTLAGLPNLSATNFGIFKQYVTTSPAPDGNFLLKGDGAPLLINGAKVPLGILPLASPAFLNGYYGIAAIDYNISDKDQLRGRYIYNKTSGIDVAATFPVFYLSLPTTYYVGTLTEYHNFTPNITNEFRLGYNRFNNTTPAGDFKFPGLDQFPNIVLNDINVNIGPDGNAPQFTIQNLYQVTENLSWVKGRHTLKFGFDGRKYITPQSFTQRSRAEYNYNSAILFLQDFTPDNLSERSLGNVIYYGDQTNLYPYFNDTWKLKPNFTLSLGVRYEFTSVPYSQRLQALNHIS
ncbi:MAG TPA: carboxypeptidase regulatory-like domain-containing protein, partial [Bryobacteraceae bacterium]